MEEVKVHKHDWKFKGVNLPIPGIIMEGKNNTGKQYVCNCGALQMRGDKK